MLCEWASCCFAIAVRERYCERARGVALACELARSVCFAIAGIEGLKHHQQGHRGAASK